MKTYTLLRCYGVDAADVDRMKLLTKLHTNQEVLAQARLFDDRYDVEVIEIEREIPQGPSQLPLFGE